MRRVVERFMQVARRLEFPFSLARLYFEIWYYVWSIFAYRNVKPKLVRRMWEGHMITLEVWPE